MDIFHFPRLNNTFGPFEAPAKKLRRNEKKLLTRSRVWCINLHRAAEKGGRGRRPSGGSLTSE